MRRDVTRRPLVSAEMLGMPGFVVLAAGECGGELELLTETVETTTGCPDCGVVAEVHARRPHLVRDVPAGGRPVLLVWSKRVWPCPEPDCARRTWTETHPQVRPKAALTERARQWPASGSAAVRRRWSGCAGSSGWAGTP